MRIQSEADCISYKNQLFSIKLQHSSLHNNTVIQKVNLREEIKNL